MMRILESLDIQLSPSSSDSSRIGNMGEVLVAGPTLISYFTKFIQYHTQYLIWWLTVTSSLFGKGEEWTHSTGGRCFISPFVCPVNGYCPYIHCSRPILQLCTQPTGKSNCLLFHEQTCWAKFRIGIIDGIIIMTQVHHHPWMMQSSSIMYGAINIIMILH